MLHPFLRRAQIRHRDHLVQRLAQPSSGHLFSVATELPFPKPREEGALDQQQLPAGGQAGVVRPLKGDELLLFAKFRSCYQLVPESCV